MIPFLSVKSQAIKLKVKPQFPSLVSATAPLTLSKIDGNFTFGLDVTALRTSLDTYYSPVMSAAESTHWDTMYRLLDPAAYLAARGAGVGFSLTVPAGQTWYTLNTWWVDINGVGPFFHRKLSIYDAVPLPAGTVITSNAAAPNAFMYYANPSLAAAPVGDPKAAFYARLATLKTIALSALKVDIAAGAANNAQLTTNFPGGFTNGMIVGVSSQDVAWTTLQFAGGGINTVDEISDRHQQRTSSYLLVPFKTSILTGVTAQGSNVPGDLAALSIAGTGMIIYQQLPAGW